MVDERERHRAHATSFEAGDQATIRSLIFRVECIRIYDLDLHVYWVIWMEEYLTSIGVGSRWIEWFFFIYLLRRNLVYLSLL
jgi:hypothetical protein